MPFGNKEFDSSEAVTFDQFLPSHRRNSLDKSPRNCSMPQVPEELQGAKALHDTNYDVQKVEITTDPITSYRQHQIKKERESLKKSSLKQSIENRKASAPTQSALCDVKVYGVKSRMSGRPRITSQERVESAQKTEATSPLMKYERNLSQEGTEDREKTHLSVQGLEDSRAQHDSGYRNQVDTEQLHQSPLPLQLAQRLEQHLPDPENYGDSALEVAEEEQASYFAKQRALHHKHAESKSLRTSHKGGTLIKGNQLVVNGPSPLDLNGVDGPLQGVAMTLSKKA